MSLNTHTSFERLAVGGEEGVSWEEANVSAALSGGSSYDTALIKLTSKVDSNLLLLNRHVILEKFTVDVVVVEEEEQEQEQGGGVLGFIQEHIIGNKKTGTIQEQNGGNKKNKNNKLGNSSELAVTEAWRACKAKGFHGLHVFAKVTLESMPNNGCRKLYSPGQYADALLNGFRSYYMFQRYDTHYEDDALSLWRVGGGDCVEPVNVYYMVLAWQLADQGRGGITNRPLPSLNITTSPTAAAPQKHGRKRAAGAQHEDTSTTTPARKRSRVTGRGPTQPPPEAATTTEEEEQEEQEVTVDIGQQKGKIPDVWYSPDIGMAKQKPSPQRPTNQMPSPKRPTNQGYPSPQRPTNQPPSPQKSTNQPPSPQKSTNQPLAPQTLVDEPDGDLSDLTFGFERSTPRGKGRRTTTASTTSRKSVLLPQWSAEEKDAFLKFYDELNPNQTEQTRIALTCKYANVRFGQDLPSKQLYQWVQQKGRTVHPPLDTYTLPGGQDADVGVNSAATDLYHGLNVDVSESKRVAFTCRLMQIQFGVELSSKELYDILSGKGQKKGVRGGKKKKV